MADQLEGQLDMGGPLVGELLKRVADTYDTHYAAIEAAYRGGATAAEIAPHARMTREGVRKLLVRRGVPRRKAAPRPRKGAR